MSNLNKGTTDGYQLLFLPQVPTAQLSTGPSGFIAPKSAPQGQRGKTRTGSRISDPRLFPRPCTPLGGAGHAGGEVVPPDRSPCASPLGSTPGLPSFPGAPGALLLVPFLPSLPETDARVLWVGVSHPGSLCPAPGSLLSCPQRAPSS